MTRTSSEPQNEGQATEHLDGLEDGCGCAEVWEHLSERRATDENSDESEPQAAVEQETDT